MFERHSRQTTTSPAVLGRLASSIAVALALLALTSGCEDKGLGRSCSLGQTIAADQGAYSVNATDCQTRMCVKPAVQPGVSHDLDTGAYCSDTCSTTSDCQQGQTRDRSNPNDRRCKSGFVCAVPFGSSDTAVGGGKLCCQKVCLCRDFFRTEEPATPESCQSGSDASCSAIQRD